MDTRRGASLTMCSQKPNPKCPVFWNSKAIRMHPGDPNPSSTAQPNYSEIHRLSTKNRGPASLRLRQVVALAARILSSSSAPQRAATVVTNPALPVPRYRARPHGFPMAMSAPRANQSCIWIKSPHLCLVPGEAVVGAARFVQFSGLRDVASHVSLAHGGRWKYRGSRRARGGCKVLGIEFHSVPVYLGR